MQIVPVILSGGSGTRLWPMSRKQYPKQFLSLHGNNSMLQETLLRLKGIKNLTDPVIVCNQDHRFIVAEQCRQIDLKDPTIILEPDGRNTAPAIISAAIHINKTHNDSLILVLSADHIIKNLDELKISLKNAIRKANEGLIVTLGIEPTVANTGFGYIKFLDDGCPYSFKVEKFIEKPDLESAQTYIEKGEYLWNSGMFVFKTSKFIDEVSSWAPEIFKFAMKSVENSRYDLGFIRLDKESFESSPSLSIDYALLEKSQNLCVVKLNAGWSDIGSWGSLYDNEPKDSDNNAIMGDVIAKDTKNSYINSNHHLVATIGVENLIVVDTVDVTFIASNDKANEVSSFVNFLKEKSRPEVGSNRKVYRPWGWYDTLATGPNFQVKRLHINPRAKLSLQKHSKRAEHWVIVEGEATVINGKKKLTLLEGDSTYIPVSVKHSLENKTDLKLEIIEVQSGTYLGEDDIVRYEDIYGRVK